MAREAIHNDHIYQSLLERANKELIQVCDNFEKNTNELIDTLTSSLITLELLEIDTIVEE